MCVFYQQFNDAVDNIPLTIYLARWPDPLIKSSTVLMNLGKRRRRKNTNKNSCHMHTVSAFSLSFYRGQCFSPLPASERIITGRVVLHRSVLVDATHHM